MGQRALLLGALLGALLAGCSSQSGETKTAGYGAANRSDTKIAQTSETTKSDSMKTDSMKSEPMKSDAMPMKTSAAGRVYDVRGEVKAVGNKQLTVHHEDIPGLMPAMTMPFSVHSADELKGVAAGDRIEAKLHMSDADSWLEKIRVVGKSKTASGGLGARAFRAPKPGQTVPKVQLVNQDGKNVTVGGASSYPQIVTFVYTRCPLPNACPLMRHRLSQLQSALKKDGSLAQARLYCVSLDPEHDTPAIVRASGEASGADFKYWQFVTGPPKNVARLASSLGEIYAPNGELVNHNLITAIIGRDGKLRRAFVGNEWKEAELLAATHDAIASGGGKKG